jgi:hypothetical protein
MPKSLALVPRSDSIGDPYRGFAPLSSNGRPACRAREKDFCHDIFFGTALNVKIPAAPDRYLFYPIPNFNRSNAAGVRFASLDPVFGSRFSGLGADRIISAEIHMLMIEKPHDIRFIWEALTNRCLREIRLGLVWELLKGQPDGQLGPLSTGRKPNLFFIRDVDQEIRAISLIWLAEFGWNLHVEALNGRLIFAANTQVFAE